MILSQFKKENKIETEIQLRNNRKLLTTKNGFNYWIVSKKNEVTQVTEEYYKTALKTRLTKKDKRNSVI